MSQIEMVVETSLIGVGLRNGVALGPAGRLAVLSAERAAWDALRALGLADEAIPAHAS